MLVCCVRNCAVVPQLLHLSSFLVVGGFSSCSVSLVFVVSAEEGAAAAGFLVCFFIFFCCVFVCGLFCCIRIGFSIR